MSIELQGDRIKHTSPDGTELPRGLVYVLPTWEVRSKTREGSSYKYYLNEDLARMEASRLHRRIWSTSRYNAYYAMGGMPKQCTLNASRGTICIWIIKTDGRRKSFSKNFTDVSDLPHIVINLELRRIVYALKNSIDLDEQLSSARDNCGNVYYIPGHYRIFEYGSGRYKTLEAAMVALKARLAKLNGESIGGVSTSNIRTSKLSQDLPVGLSEFTTERKTKSGTTISNIMRSIVIWEGRVVHNKSFAYGRKITREEAIEKCLAERKTFLRNNPQYTKYRRGVNKRL